MNYSIQIYFLIFFVYSFAGWCMESFGSVLNPKVKKFINRGFLIGPVCPVYGIGVIAIEIFLGKYTNDLITLFILSIVVCGTLEYLTSYLMEKMFHAKWWDYSNRKFNINGRICLETLLPFGIIGDIILCICNPFLAKCFMMIEMNVLNIVIIIFSIIFIIDFIISFKIISSFKGEIYKNQDNTEEISDKVKDKAEDIIMKAESEVKFFSRKLKLKELKLERKIKYNGKEAYLKILDLQKNKINSFNEKKNLFNNQLKERQKCQKELFKQKKEEIGSWKQKSKQIIEQKIENAKISSDEFSNKIKNKFGKKSIFNNRLIKAFPNLQINEKIIKIKGEKNGK